MIGKIHGFRCSHTPKIDQMDQHQGRDVERWMTKSRGNDEMVDLGGDTFNKKQGTLQNSKMDCESGSLVGIYIYIQYIFIHNFE